MGRTRGWRAVVVGISVMVIAPCANAELIGPLRKLARGSANTVTGWLELPIQMARTTELEGSLSGLSIGLVRGVGFGVGRTLLGGYEVITFPLRNYPREGGRDPYGALIEPAFVVFREPDKP